MSNIYTDLALESAEALTGADSNGVFMTAEETQNTVITRVRVTDDKGAELLGKPIGNYITIESQGMKENDITVHEEIIKILSDEIAVLIEKAKKRSENSLVFIVGLGNRNVTPDALGPRVVSKVLVTRHIMGDISTREGMTVRPVSVLSPGVMGTTGIETYDIIDGICKKTKPALVIAIDALAARCTSRINATIQISDTGLCPGAGMNNSRKAVTEEFLGVPVIAVGVPTVVDAATLVSDTMDIMLDSMINELPEGSEFLEMLKSLEDREKYSVIKRALDPYAGNMFVTPKEVDAVMDRLSNIIANAINISLHPGIDKDDINRFMY